MFGFVFVNFAYAIAVGGDFMAMQRFLIPSVPFLAVCFAAGIDRLLGASPTAVRRSIAVLLVAASSVISLLPAFDRHVVPEDLRWRFHFRWNDLSRENFMSEYEMWKFMRENAIKWSELGHALALHTAPDEHIVPGTIGAMSYYADRYIYDSFGLTNREIAVRPPVIRDKPPYLQSPGHEGRGLNLEFFRGRRVDCVGAMIVDTADPFRGLDPIWAADLDPDFTIEKVPLPESEGFGPGRTLLLVRVRR